MPTTGKLLVVLAVSLPVILIGGVAYKKAMEVTWGEALTKAYHVMGNCPGIDITQEKSTAALVIINAVYLAGLLGFAVVLGIVTDDIGSAVAEVRGGNFAVAERNHTVVLGWNRTTLPILRQVRSDYWGVGGWGGGVWGMGVEGWAVRIGLLLELQQMNNPAESELTVERLHTQYILNHAAQHARTNHRLRSPRPSPAPTSRLACRWWCWLTRTRGRWIRRCGL